jgi:methyl-accepting chemotaxis protein
MNGPRFTIRQKIIWGFAILISVFCGLASYSIYTSYKGNQTILYSQEVINPSKDAVKDFILLVTRSKMLISNWVYLPDNQEDKEALIAIHNYEYIEVKNRLLDHTSDIEIWSELVGVDSICQGFEEILGIEREIMNNLDAAADYEDIAKKQRAIEFLNSGIFPVSAQLVELLEGLDSQLDQLKDKVDEEVTASFEKLIKVISLLAMALLLLGSVLAYSIAKTITNPMTYLREVIDRIAKGELVPIDSSKILNDEIGDMARSLSSMSDGFAKITEFAEGVGDGKYDVEFKPLSDNDVLGNALVDMGSKLRKLAEEDKKRIWATNGLAKFGDILRSSNDDLHKLANEIVAGLVNYLDANQGALFIVETDKEGQERPCMELAACYAWDKKKFIEKKICKGEGLIGQCWIEGDVMYLTDIPDDYVSITSGLGEANPRSILIVPVKLHEEIHGLIELASFNEYEDFQIDFLKRIAERIAATISAVKVNERTSRLLEESTMMTEQLRAQEEEMRQNMEELQATQDKIEHDQLESEARERIILSGTMVFELSKHFAIRSSNELASDILQLSSDELEGKMFRDLMEDAADLIQIKEFATEDTYWNGILKLKSKNGEQIKLLVSAGKVKDSVYNDSVCLIYGKDMTIFLDG